MKKFVFVLIAATTLTFNASGSSIAASNKDKALSLTASGCLAGMIDTPFYLNNIPFLVISTATSSQWNEATNNDLVQIHHTQLLEGWSIAANLDPKWSKLSNTYITVYDFIGREASRGKLYGEITGAAERKYGGIINANCKIAITSAQSKAKASGKTFPRWIISTAGNLLPPLDLRTGAK
jgi:hypothetical protein